MNTINFDQTGGFPLETETLKKMQEAYGSLQQLGALAGNAAIISGCSVSGSTTSDGFIFYQGELIRFVGGITQSKIIIQETTEDAEYEDGELKPTYNTRVAKFGTGTGQIEWNLFKRMYPQTSALFIDEVRMYAGNLNNLPEGWFLCNGQNNTADLRGQFIVGYDPANSDYNTIGKKGGQKEVTLTESQIPAHKHTGTTSTNGSHTHNAPAEGSSSGSDVHFNVHAYDRKDGQTNSAGNHNHTLNINNAGGGQAHENRPPFYVLAYIQFKGI